MDVETAMLEEGRKRAKKAGTTNVRWILSRAKDVEIPAASVDLITAGESFHRMDQTVVAEQAMNWLRTGSHLAILWYVNFYRRAEPWHTIVEDVVSRWKERLPASPVAQLYSRNNQPFEEILEDAGFGGVASFEFSTPHDWALDDIIGLLYSRSNVRRSLFDHTDAFETDLKKALLSYDPTGTFHEIAQFGYLLA